LHRVRLAEWARTFSLDRISGLPTFPGLSEEDIGTYYGFTAFPNLLANLLPDTVMTYLLLPLAPDRTRVVSEYLFRPEVVPAMTSIPAQWCRFSTSSAGRTGRCASAPSGGFARGRSTGACCPGTTGSCAYSHNGT
jgi:hypothetical protein